MESFILRTIPQDKCLHALAGVFVFSAFHFGNRSVGISSVVVAASPKEVVDHFTDGDVSIWEVTATIVGGLLGFLCNLG